ncbi:MAG TPA: hypothetical protein VFF20_11255 [Pseudogracilibacillus sp.]|nr:hypothetical protein [Pseudogracilibacillus sp.]
MLTARQILESKGFKINEETIDGLEARWQGLNASKKEIDVDTYFAANKFGLTNVAGGDKHE